MAVVALASAPAAAQFTATIPPRAPSMRARAESAAADSAARRDTTIARRFASMREWVDSAALASDVAVPAAPAGDSAAVAARERPAHPAPATETAARPPAPPAAPSGTTTTESEGTVARMEGGMPAPDTATPLPLLALLGAAGLLAGARLLRR
jgi:hypothetical protein